MKIKIKYLGVITIILICLSCSNREAYYHFNELKSGEWSKFDTIYFNIDSSSINVNTKYDITIELVNNTEYPYQNIWLYIQDDFDKKGFSKTEKQYQMADALGKWSGSGFGSLYQLSLNYKQQVVFSEKRSYQLKIVQGMRDEPLIGIEKIGLKIEPSHVGE